MIDGYDDSWTEFEPHEDAHIIDGPPRLSHKTTKMVQAASGFADRHNSGVPVVIDNNYEQVDETVENHFGGGKYGVDPETTVVPKGKDRAIEYCPDGCEHSLDGSSYGKVHHKAQEVAAQNSVVRPATFRGEDVCAYQATKFAMEHADVIVCVAQMFYRIVDHSNFPDVYQVLIDEESTQNYFRPSGFKLAEIQPANSDIGPPFIVDFEIDEQNVNNVYQREQDKIDDLERVASRYRNITNACEWLEDLLQQATNYDFNDEPNLDEYTEYLRGIEAGSVELQGPVSERSATFDRIRMDYHRFGAAQALEAAFFESEIQVISSGDHFDVRVIPDPTSGFLVNKEAIQHAEEVWLVGDMMAKDFADQCGVSYEYTMLEPNARDLDDLKLVMVKCEEDEEMERRRFLTDVSKELAEQRIAHPVFAGSGLRAQQAKERIGPSSYFFNAQAQRQHYEEIADVGYAITSYPGSRISRGIDLPTNATIVRSTQFQSGVWDYTGESKSDDVQRKCKRMRRYSKEIEIHNMMLRGAGQGEKHVAVVPSMVPYFGLDSEVEQVSIHDDLSDVVSLILSHIKNVEKRDGLFWCSDCSTGFVSMPQYREHRKDGRCTVG